MKNIALYYYSGAGNTKYIANKVRQQLIEKDYDVNIIRVSKKSITVLDLKADYYIVGFPVYDLSAPSLVTELVKNLKAENKAISYFCTKAFMSVDAILDLHNISRVNGLRTVAVQDFYMPATDALALFAKKGSKIEKILKYFHSRKIPKKVSRFISKMEKGADINIKAKWYNILSVLIPKSVKQSFHDQYKNNIPLLHSKENICIECMLCVKNCPQENIYFRKVIEFGSQCDLCLRCLHHCPVDAIQLGKMTEGKVRYKKVELL